MLLVPSYTGHPGHTEGQPRRRRSSGANHAGKMGNACCQCNIFCNGSLITQEYVQSCIVLNIQVFLGVL